MKIAAVTGSFLPQVGGAEFVIHNLARQWSLLGHDVRVINAVADNPTHPEANYRTDKFFVPRGSTRFGYHRFPFSQLTVRSLGKALRQFNPDAISAHFVYPVGYWLSRIKPLPGYTITSHGNDITPFYWGDRAVRRSEGAFMRGLSCASRVIAISSYCREYMTGLKIPPEKIVYIPNGVDVERFQKRVAFDLRRRFDLPESAPLVLSVGREHPQKDFKTGITAFARVAAGVPDARYVILGRGVGANRELAERMGLAGKVVLCNGLDGDELVGAYQQADVLLSSSVWELHSLVVMEGLAAGAPCVVTDVSGSPDVIEDGRNGFVVEPGDADAMAQALLKVLSDPEMRARMRRTNRQKALEYDWGRISRQYLQCMTQSNSAR